MNRLDQSLVSGIPGQAARLKRGTRLVLGLLDSLEGGAIDVNLPGGLSRRVGRGPRRAAPGFPARRRPRRRRSR